MKLEKREITLNEKDSLTDALFMQKTLLKGYICVMENAYKQETRKEALRLFCQAAEDLYVLKDMLEGCEE